MKIEHEVVKAIYDRLGDDLSRRIFTDRLMYSLTGDCRFLWDCIETYELGAEFVSLLRRKKEEGREICAYGAGVSGRFLYDAYSTIIDFFVDKNYKNISMGVPVLSPEILRDHTAAFVVITLGAGWEKDISVVVDTLRTQGFSEEQICVLYQYYPYFEEHAYFDLPYLKWQPDSVFLDVGAFDGSTSVHYIKRCREMFPSSVPEVIAVEPNSTLADRVAEALNQETGVPFRVVKQGVWDVTGTTKFRVTPAGMFEEDEHGAIEMECITIDDILQGKPVDMIKMDIEGSEYRAIKGASNTIRSCKPQLAISVYHKPEDIIELPQLIMELNPAYKFYLRHYYPKANETDLYAIPAE